MNEARQTMLDAVLTDLDLGLTFLEVAETTENVETSRRNIGNALTALRTADKVLTELGTGPNIEVVQQRRDQLAQRLRAIMDHDP